jgi:hypothetical protein
MGLNIDISVRVDGVYTGANDIANPEQDVAVKGLLSLVTGSGAGLASKLFSDTRTLAASATESLDLAGSLTDAFGQTLTFAHVKAIYVKAHADNVNDVVLGGAGSNPFVGPWGATGTHAVHPGGFVLLADANGFTVTAATGDLLKVANSSSGTGVTYDIVIIGD